MVAQAGLKFLESSDSLASVPQLPGAKVDTTELACAWLFKAFIIPSSSSSHLQGTYPDSYCGKKGKLGLGKIEMLKEPGIATHFFNPST